LIFRTFASVVTIVALWVSCAAAQQVTAEVRTWTGQSFTVNDPTFEIFYTIMPSVTVALGGGGGYAGAVPGGVPGAVPGGAPTGMIPAPRGDLGQQPVNIGVGSVGFQAGTAVMAASGTLLPEGQASKQGRRQQDTVRFSRQGVEVHVPVANLTSLVFTRNLVQRSGLPPYAALAHFRHGATAVLVDGSQIEADYVNLGTGILRGGTPQGTIDIPWDEIEVIRFRR
jgi:hypothetical protein